MSKFCSIITKVLAIIKKVILGITGEHNVLFKKKGGGSHFAFCRIHLLFKHLSDLRKDKRIKHPWEPWTNPASQPTEDSQAKTQISETRAHSWKIGNWGSTHWVCDGVFPEKRGRHLYCCYVLLAFSCSDHTQPSSSSDVALYHQLWTNHSSTVVHKHLCAVFIEITSWFLQRSKQALAWILKINPLLVLGVVTSHLSTINMLK